MMALAYTSGPDWSAVVEALMAINAEHGFVDPETIVDIAREETSPLHDYFEWDDTEAARGFRLIQAAGLIRRVRVKITTNDEIRSVRGFLPASMAGRDLPAYAYISQDELVNDPGARESVLRQMRRDISACERRYSHLAEFWSEINGLAEKAP